MDSVSSYFGMRKIALRKDDQGFTRIALNDQCIFEVGTLDQGFWPDGIYTAPTDEALRSDIEFLKNAGFNLTRKHVKVEPDRWYYWCDKLGLLVWQDMPSGNNATVEGRRDFENELLRMVDGLGNHPSIIMWVLFNEGWGQYDTEPLAAWLKDMDPSRLVDNASGWTDMRAGDVIDMHNYPGPNAPSPEPHRAAVLGEYGGMGLAVEGHLWSTHQWGYIMLTNRSDLADRYVKALEQVWELHNLGGLSAAIYTQTADVETECNGLQTYDRAVAKIDANILRAANTGKFYKPPKKIILADALYGRSSWRYTTEKPADNWYEPEFDASAWIPTSYKFVMPDENGWSRYLHFEAAWVLVLTALVYGIASLVNGHFRRDIVPERKDWNWRAYGERMGRYLRRERPDRSEAGSYNVLQRTAYAGVIFVLFPLIYLDWPRHVAGVGRGVSADRCLAGRASDGAHAALFSDLGAGAVSGGARGDGGGVRFLAAHAGDDFGTGGG